MLNNVNAISLDCIGFTCLEMKLQWLTCRLKKLWPNFTKSMNFARVKQGQLYPIIQILNLKNTQNQTSKRH